ncbi:MAG: tRNA (guanosine(46)-N7)-methyltransferase TrmB, partial [Deinococcus-Thermus bacterium]|jgi:tRNA (guanine-N7-)-methyltransferase|nr:tRNA (guanosine(46)-N7)-methyltransferase TrmB [Deinococcota bacterium]
VLRLASDDAPLVDWMLFETRRHPAFAWTARRAADWRERPADAPPTRYEAKRLHGTPAFLDFRRRPRA